MITDFFASLLFYLLPILIGIFVTTNIILAWFWGAFIIYLIYIVVYTISKMVGLDNIFPLSAVTIITVLSLVSLLKWSIYNTKTLPINNFFKNNFFQYYPLLVLMLLSTLIYFGVWKSQTPYPLHLNWDIYEHMTATNKIGQGSFSLLSSQTTDTFTFNSYSTIFYVLLSLPLTLISGSFIGTYWWLEFWHYLLTIVAVYYLTIKIFNRHSLAFTAGFLSSLAFESSIAYTTLFLLPQTFTALISMFYLTTLPINQMHLDKLNPLVIVRLLKKHIIYIIPLITILLFHFIIGPVAIGVILLIIFLYSKYVSKNILKTISYISLILLIMVLLSNLIGNFDLTNREEANYFGLTLFKKFELLANWYGYGFIILFLLNVYIFFKENLKPYKIIAITTLVILSISLLPIAYFLKYFVLAHYFLVVLLSYTIHFIIRNFSPFTKTFLLSWLIFAFFIVFYTNQLSFKSPFYFNGNYSQLSKGEIDAAQWLTMRYNKLDTLIISDPGTQYIIEGLSGINSQGGAYMNTPTRNTLNNINWESDPKKISKELTSIKDNLAGDNLNTNKRLFVVGGRYFAWQRLPLNWKNSSYYNIWRPQTIDPTDYSYINFLSSNFKVVYQNDELIIFEL